MATDGWRSGRSLNQQIRDNSGSFDFYQLVNLLDLETRENVLEAEVMIASADNQRSTPTRYRFKADLSSSFPASDIRSVSVKRTPDMLVASTTNYCVSGYSGPLPEGFSDWIYQQQRSGQRATADFLDIFNHRANLLRFQTRSSSIQALDRRHPDSNLLADGIAATMGALDKLLSNRVPLSRRNLMSLAGLLANHRINAKLIQRVMSVCFGVPLSLSDLVGAWRDIAKDQICQLGVQSSNLGEICLLGKQTWDMKSRLRATVGPIPFSQLLTLLPDFDYRHQRQVSPKYHAFLAMWRYLTNGQVDIEVDLQVQPETVPKPYLRYPESADAAHFRLGQTSWLGCPKGDQAISAYLVTGLDADTGIHNLSEGSER